jgi:hypothetical protein
MGTMSVLDQTGDTKTIWDKNNPVEVESARKTFNDLKAKGYIAYTVKDDGKKGEILVNFNSELERIILSPPVCGG